MPSSTLFQLAGAAAAAGHEPGRDVVERDGDLDLGAVADLELLLLDVARDVELGRHLVGVVLLVDDRHLAHDAVHAELAHGTLGLAGLVEADRGASCRPRGRGRRAARCAAPCGRHRRCGSGTPRGGGGRRPRRARATCLRPGSLSGRPEGEQVLLADRGAQGLGQLAVDGQLGERGLEVAAEVVVDDAQGALQHGEEHGVLGLELRLAQEVAARVDHVAGTAERIARDVLDVDADGAQIRPCRGRSASRRRRGSRRRRSRPRARGCPRTAPASARRAGTRPRFSCRSSFRTLGSPCLSLDLLLVPGAEAEPYQIGDGHREVQGDGCRPTIRAGPRRPPRPASHCMQRVADRPVAHQLDEQREASWPPPRRGPARARRRSPGTRSSDDMM